MLRTACRKFPRSAKVWLRHYAWLARVRGGGDPACRLLERALVALPHHKHIKVQKCGVYYRDVAP